MFGDPCFGTVKYLNVTYECRPGLGVCPAVCPTEWTKINQQEDGVQWGAMGDSYGSWQVASTICGQKLKLQHRSGGISCAVSLGRYGKFGCGVHTRAWSSLLAVYVTEGKGSDYVIVPSVLPHAGITLNEIYIGLYQRSGYNSMSPYVEFDLPLNADNSYFCFEEGKEYQLWHGKDMYDTDESRNDGTTYTDIYIMS